MRHRTKSGYIGFRCSRLIINLSVDGDTYTIAIKITDE